jgi:tRNA modification GTPase
LRLVDTAGLRETDDRIERLGIEVSERYLAEAHVVLACGESPEQVEETINVVARNSSAPILAVRTKADLVIERDKSAQHRADIAVSAETGFGLQDLVEAIDEALREKHGEIAADLPILTRARHRHALTVACSEIEQFRRAWREENLPATIAAIHLRTAVSTLEELIGTVEVEDVFDRVFSSFCVGK